MRRRFALYAGSGLLLALICAGAWIHGPALEQFRAAQETRLRQAARLHAEAVDCWLAGNADTAGRTLVEDTPAGLRLRHHDGMALPHSLHLLPSRCDATPARPLTPLLTIDGAEYLLFYRQTPRADKRDARWTSFFLELRAADGLRRLLTPSPADGYAVALRLPAAEGMITLQGEGARMPPPVQRMLNASSTSLAPDAPLVQHALPAFWAVETQRTNGLLTAATAAGKGRLLLFQTDADAAFWTSVRSAFPWMALLAGGWALMTFFLLRALRGKGSELCAPAVDTAQEAEGASLKKKLRQTQAALDTATRQRRQLSGQLINMLEDIRHELSRELHDQIGQMLTTLLLELDVERQRGLPPPACAQSLPRRAARPSVAQDANNDAPQHDKPENSTAPQDVLTRTEHRVRRIQAEVRRLARGLRPPALDMLGLTPALEGLFEEYPSLDIHFFHESVPRLEAAQALTLYRVTQEALTNALKHANATRIHVSLTARDAVLTLTVEDDGKGFDPAAPPDLVDTANPTDTANTANPTGAAGTGLGLRLMRERMEQWGGTLQVDSRPEQGTLVLAELPLSA